MRPKRLRYQNFDLAVQPVDGGYLARVLSSPSGEAQAVIEDALYEDELLDFMDDMVQFLDSERPDESFIERFEAFGRGLFESVFAGDVLSMWRTSLARSEAQGAGLRLRLHLNDAPELNRWPWEVLYDPIADSFVALSANTPVIRYLDMPVAIDPPPVALPLRIVVAAAQPADLPELAVDEEWAKLEGGVRPLQAQGRIELDRLPEATALALQRHLRRNQTHIFHFIGHGAFDTETERGVLVFEDGQGFQRPEDADRIGVLLRDHVSLRLAVLNACEGAGAGVDNPFAGIAQTLVRKGVPAVIAMQFEITDEAAIAFTSEFYAALADGYPVDAALAEARRALYIAGNDAEWITPALYMRTSKPFFEELSPSSPAASSAEAGDSSLHGAQVDGQGDGQGGVQVNIDHSTVTDSAITVNVGVVDGAAANDAPAAGQEIGLSPASMTDELALHLTRLEGQLRRYHRELIGLEDRLTLSESDEERARLQQQFDRQTALLQNAMGEYATLIDARDWPTPVDVQEILTYAGAG